MNQELKSNCENAEKSLGEGGGLRVDVNQELK